MKGEYVFIGFFVGFLVGLTGVGGGSIMTPLLIAFGVNSLVAVGTDLALSVPTKIYAAYLHYRRGTINFDLLKWLCIGGIPATAAGLLLIKVLHGRAGPHALETWVRHAVGGSLCIAALLLLISLINRSPRKLVPLPSLRTRVVAIGAAVGFLVSVTSIGSGSVTLSLLVLSVPFQALNSLISTDLAFAALLVPTAAAGHWSMGNVDFPLMFTLLIGSFPGVYLGSKMCATLEQRWLRPAVAVVLVIAGIRLIAI